VQEVTTVVQRLSDSHRVHRGYTFEANQSEMDRAGLLREVMRLVEFALQPDDVGVERGSLGVEAEAGVENLRPPLDVSHPGRHHPLHDGMSRVSTRSRLVEQPGRSVQCIGQRAEHRGRFVGPTLQLPHERCDVHPNSRLVLQ
jgi:hypothetical protein